LEPTCS